MDFPYLNFSSLPLNPCKPVASIVSCSKEFSDITHDVKNSVVFVLNLASASFV